MAHSTAVRAWEAQRIAFRVTTACLLMTYLPSLRPAFAMNTINYERLNAELPGGGSIVIRIDGETAHVHLTDIPASTMLSFCSATEIWLTTHLGLGNRKITPGRFAGRFHRRKQRLNIADNHTVRGDFTLPVTHLRYGLTFLGPRTETD
ncbi:hypothetical protein ACFVYG_22390 [Streptomyces sp. NPDC058256]|uniref:hypothetical protein n=1 Tax=Streptomyces sp. NPDC058256 TaxID=3346408 RepID=UPI0036E94279